MKAGEGMERRRSVAREDKPVEARTMDVRKAPEGPRDYVGELEKMGTIDYLLGGGRVMAMLLEWAKIDPEAALDWVLGMSDRDRRDYFSREVMSLVADADPRRAMKLLERFPDPDSKGKWEATKTVVKGLGKVDPEEALAYIRSLGSEGRGEMLMLIAGEMAKRDIGRALALLEDEDAGGARSAVASKIVLEWAKQDFRAAFVWVMAQPDFQNGWALPALAGAWAEADLEGALAHPWQPGSLFDSGAMMSIMEVWAKRDPQTARAWLEQSAFNADVQIHYSLFRSWGASDPTGAAQAINHVEYSDRDLNLMTRLVEQTASDSREEAAAMVDGLKNPKVQRTAMVVLMKDWYDGDPGGAEAWVSSLEEGPLREGAAAVLISDASADDPALAAEWLKKVPNLEGREELIDHVGTVWLFLDEGEGRRLLGELGVSGDRVEEMKGRIPR